LFGQNCGRYLQAAAQHAAVQQRHYVDAGRLLLSGPAAADLLNRQMIPHAFEEPDIRAVAPTASATP
jgi:hypothetical protein